MSPHYFRAYNHHSLTPVAKLLAMKVCGAEAPQENGENISIVFVHTLLHWAGCSRVQMTAALDELKERDILKEWRWCEVKARSEEGGTYQAILSFMAPLEGWEVEEFDDEAPPQPEDIVEGDTTGVTRIDPRRARILAKTEGKCFYCVEATAEHLDHMHPKSRGGSDADDNMIGACATCNIQKNDRTVDEYRAYLAYKRKVANVDEILFYGEKIETAA